MSTFFVRILALLGILSSCQNSDVDVTTQLPNNPYPVNYNVELDLSQFAKNDVYNGTCYIRLKFDRNTRINSISFHAKQSQITIHDPLIFVRNRFIRFVDPRFEKWIKTRFEPMRYEYKNNDIMRIDLNYTYDVYNNPRINYILKIPFKTKLYSDEDGLFKTSYIINKQGREILVLGTNGARRIFPCWDDPAFNATFNFTIKHLTSHIVFSNMPYQNRRSINKDTTLTQFVTTPSIPPHLVAILVLYDRFYSLTINKRTNLVCRSQIARHLEYAKMVFKNVTLHMELTWRICKIPETINHFAIPRFHQESMNKFRLVFYRETDLIYDEQLDPIIRKVDVALLVARAVAHECLDNSVSFPLWSTHLWLKEAILTLNAADTINKISPDFRIWDLFVVQIQQESLRLDDSGFIMKPLMSGANSTEINSQLVFTSYIKAPAILRMLQQALSYDVFRDGIGLFLHSRKYKSSFLDDFWTAMQHSLNISSNIRFNVKNIMNPWTKLHHYRVLTVDQQSDVSQVKISIKDGRDCMVSIPVTFSTQHNYDNFNNTSPYYKSLTTPDMATPLWINNTDNIVLPSKSSGWLIINIQQAGYYRVNYDATYWGRIVHYLTTSDEYTKIHVLNRAQIIDDAFYFLINNQLPLSTFLNLTKYLQRETDFIAWYPMIKALEYMSGSFLFEENSDLKIHMRDILHELLENITYTEKLDEKPNDLIKCLRQEAAKWACVLGDNNCKSEAVLKLQLHLNNTERLSPEWKNWMYCNALGPNANSNVWWDVWYTWANKTDNKLLKYLSCSTSPDIIQNYLNIITNKSENVTMQPKDRVNSFLFTVAKHAKNNKVLEYILKNFEKIKPREVGIRVTLINIINHVQSEEQLNKVLKFVKDYKEELETIYKEINFYKFGVVMPELSRKIEWDMERIVNYIDLTALAVKLKINARLENIAVHKLFSKPYMKHKF